MSSSDLAISASGLWKAYRIFERPQDRLKQAIVPRLASVLGLPRPKYFREFEALRDVTFDVRRGETVGIIGRNGAGKSTLLQILCGTLAPSAGAVNIKGRVAALLELGSGFNPEFTGRENVLLNASVLGLTNDQIRERFDRIAAFADIGDFIERPVKTYSSGMVVRLAFAVISHVDADILVIDEALSVGDAYFTQKCMRFLRSFMQRGTVLFVSHDTGAVLNLCQRAIWLQSGSIKAIGDPKDLIDDYLADYFRSMQGDDEVLGAGLPTATTRDEEEVIDQRMAYINATSLRNDLEVFRFNAESSEFGLGGAQIVDVGLFSAGRRINWCVGGELVTLCIRCKARGDLSSPILGFQVKDRLGQTLFSDNTFISYARDPQFARAGRILQAEFTFRMPILPVGDYSVSAAIAEGTQAEHVQHHWMHEALLFKSHSSSVSTGLVGVPMKTVELRVLADEK
jgi:lipopolysaccharide transport system ATP-binding protein